MLLGLTGCAAGNTTPAADGTTPAARSGIAGITVIDNCPVQRAGSPCAGVAVAAQVSIVDSGSGTVVATATSRADGHFTVAVEPGRYLIRVVSVGTRLPHPQNPASVTVTAGQFTPVTVHIDVGIR
jgi:hypothetical protein